MSESRSTGNAIDLRRGRILPVLLGLPVFGCLAVGMWWSILWWPPALDAALLSLVVAVVVSVLFLLCVMAALQLRHSHRLVIDHEGIRMEVGGRKPRWRLAWTEMAGIGTVRGPSRPGRRGARDPSGQALLIDPLDADAVRRHPELALPWNLGKQRQWRIVIGDLHPDQPSVADLVGRWRPELWRGERTGSVLFG